MMIPSILIFGLYTWSDLLIQETFELVEDLSGEKVERQYVSIDTCGYVFGESNARMMLAESSLGAR